MRQIQDVTIETFPLAVRRAGLRPGQRFTILVEDEEEEEERTAAFKKMQDASAKATRIAQNDGIITDEDVERFLEI